MDKIVVTNNVQQNITVLSNEFIDQHMKKADGEYVKIYLLILRLTGEHLPVNIDQLADMLELTRKDILRALKYWEKEGVLEFGEKQESSSDLSANSQKTETASSLPYHLPAVPKKSNRSATEMEPFINGTDLGQTIYMAETYLGRPLSASELNSFCYINNELHFSSELLEYLIEYCITRGKKSVRYMESVAINWFQQEIDSVKKAKEQSSLYTQNVFPVMKAFGIANRNPGPAEIDYIKKWNSLGFGTDIIVEACNRTLLATHQASFHYANRILEDWKKSGVRHVSDIKSLDRQFHASSSEASSDGASSGGSKQPDKKTPSNSFHNFEQGSYNYEELESRLVNKKRR